MKNQNFGPRLDKLVHQLPRVVTFAYDLHLAIIIPHFEDIEEKDKN